MCLAQFLNNTRNARFFISKSFLKQRIVNKNVMRISVFCLYLLHDFRVTKQYFFYYFFYRPTYNQGAHYSSIIMRTFTFYFFSCILLCLGGFPSLQAQDTTVIQTFTFASTTRAGFFQFPPDTATYEKIIMQYRMRCKNALISTQSAPNQGCGEWDYSCNTYLTDSSMVDSVKATHNNYTITNFNGTTYLSSNTPTFSYTQYAQQDVSYSTVNNETVYPVGSGITAISHPFANGQTTGKSQYLWTAAELTAAGLMAGDIHSLELDLTALGGASDFLRVKMKATSNSTLTQIDKTGFQQVYFLNTTFATTGFQRLKFYQPFNWDGVSNIIVELNYNNNTATNSSQISAETPSFQAAVKNTTDDYYVDYDGANSYADAGDVNELDGASQFTYEAWVNIQAWKNWSNIFDKNNTCLLQTGDQLGYLYCIVRPSTNTYGYAANVLPLKTWVHVAMVFDGTQIITTNRLKLYVNGQAVALIYNGAIPSVTDINTNPLKMGTINGLMDNARVWNVALSPANIAAWMNRKIDNTHPNFANLAASYEMNEGNGTSLTDNSGHGYNATLMTGTEWGKFKGNDIFKDLVPVIERPNVHFVQGSYVTAIDTLFLLDSIQNQINMVTAYEVQNNNLITLGTTTTWQGGYSYIKNEAGMVVDSVLFPADDTLAITTLDYYSKWPSKLELMSFVTPYGKGLDLGVNGKMWEYDVTDFGRSLLGNKYINIEKGGEWQEDLDIKFLFIKGTPPRNVLSMQQIWPVTADAYQNILNNKRYEPRNIALRSDAAYFKVRSAISGHGQEGEFIPRSHFINVNGGAIDFQWNVWKECAYNPVYPQGGTWVYDRAGWCPGMATDIKEMNITPLVTPGQNVTLDYGLTTASGDSRYIVNNQLVQYGPANFSLDAAVADLSKPSDMIVYGRSNPVCMKPVVKIQNTGSTPLTSLKITYGMVGSTPITYQWAGNLNFLQTADVTLPLSNWSTTSGKFYATVSQPNGGVDMYAKNNTRTTNYVVTPVLPSKIVVEFKSNNNPNENAYTVLDESGAMLLAQNGFSPNTVYTDTLTLADGCYELKLTDQGSDGLEWWASAAQGTGYLRIRDAATGVILNTFGKDFGAEIYYQFTASSTWVGIGEQTAVTKSFIAIFPNPTSGEVNIQANFPHKQSGTIEVLDLNGRAISYHTFEDKLAENWNLDLSQMAKGMYLVVMRNGKEVLTQKLIVQ